MGEKVSSMLQTHKNQSPGQLAGNSQKKRHKVEQSAGQDTVKHKLTMLTALSDAGQYQMGR